MTTSACGAIVYELYKIQTESENHEIFGYLMISCMVVMVKIWLDFSLFSQMLLTNWSFSEEDADAESFEDCS